MNNKTHKRKDFIKWFEEKNQEETALSFKILEECRDEDRALNLAEIKWFDKHKPRFYGKKPSKSETWTHSEKTRKKISKSLRLFHGNTGKALKDREKVCLTCNKVFFSARQTSKYCSHECVDWDKRTFKDGLTPINNLDGVLISKLYKNGKSLREVAKEIGVSHTTIRKVLTREGTPIKAPGGRKRQ